MLKLLQKELSQSGIEFRIVEARSAVRDFLRVEGLEERVGGIGRFKSLADMIDEFEGGQSQKKGATAPRLDGPSSAERR